MIRYLDYDKYLDLLKYLSSNKINFQLLTQFELVSPTYSFGNEEKGTTVKLLINSEIGSFYFSQTLKPEQSENLKLLHSDIERYNPIECHFKSVSCSAEIE